MSLLVVDSSVIIKCYLPEVDTDKADAILADAYSSRVELIAPEFLLLELASILWKHVYQVKMSRALAEAVMADLEYAPVKYHDLRPLLAQAFDLAATHQRTVYDMLYVALAVREGCDFVTADERLANSLASAMPQVKKLASWT